MDNPNPLTSFGNAETYDLLKDDSPIPLEIDKPEQEIPQADKKKEKEEDDDEKDDDGLAKLRKEIEEEKEPSEEELELVTPARRQAILKKYPQLFKDFPALQASYYRDQKFTEIFPTVQEAKNAQERVEVLERFEAELLNGNIGSVLQTVKDANPQAFAKIVDNLIVHTRQVDNNAFGHIYGNMVKATVQNMVKEAGASQNEDLRTAAHILYKFIFGQTDYVPPSTFSKEEPKQSNQLDQEKQQFYQERLNTYGNELTNRVNNSIKATIDLHIDPKKLMPPYVRAKATEDCLANVQSMLLTNQAFKTQLDRLWGQAAKANFSKPALDSIRSFVLSRSKEVLGDVILKIRGEALKGLGRSKQSSEDDDAPRDRTPVTPGRSSSSARSRGNGKVPAGMSSLDFLNSDE